MLRLLGALVLVAAIVGAIAYWRGWLTFRVDRPDDGNTNVNVKVNKDKFREDVDRVQGSVKDVGAREVKGQVASVDRDKKTVAVQDTQETVTLRVTESTTIQIGDRNASLADLQPGARVSASYVSQDGTNTARSIRVDTPARGATGS